MDTSLSEEIPALQGYQNVRLIRAPGGRSHVYRGTRTRSGQEVTIMLSPAPRDGQDALKFQRRFNQELLVARLPAHNHVLAALDHGEIPGHGSGGARWYVAYPYIQHGSLADLLTLERPWETWEWPHIADVIAQAARGLSHLHNGGMVHQEVRPGTVLWMPTDVVRNPLRRIHVWLTGFGPGEPERDGTGREIDGAPNYLAPEQASGEITHAVDQYALALLARLLLTGHEPPLPSESPSPLSPRPTRLQAPGLFEPALDDALLKALAPRPEARFSSVIEFAQALQEAVLKQVQRTLYAAPSDSPLARANPQPATPPLSMAPPAWEARSAAPSAPAALKEPVVLPPLNPPKPYEPPRPREGYQPKGAARNTASGLALPALPAQKWFTLKLPGALRMLAWSPAGTELACTFYHDLPQVIGAKRSVETIPGFEHAHSACWSPDGRFLAMSMDDEQHPRAEIRFWDRTGRERPRVLSLDQREPVRGMDWSRRGLFAIWVDHRLLVYDLSSISTQKRLPEPAYTLLLEDDMFCDQLTTLRWSPSGEWLAAGSNYGQIVCWQPHTDQWVQEQPLKKTIRSIGWSPNGKVLIAAFANKQVLLWDMQTGDISQAKVPEHPRMVSISQHTGQFAVATEQALFFFEHMGALAPTALHPGQLFAAFSAENKLATLNQVDGTELIIWQLS